MKEQHVNFNDIEYCEIPFKYLICQEVLNKESANFLFNWLDTTVDWRLHTESFFEQYESNLLNENIPEECKFLVNNEFIQSLKIQLQNTFKVEFDRRVNISAHKFICGQGVGIHNDNPKNEEYETHRFILNLNPDFQDSYGGHLVFFNSNDESDFNRIFRPIHNSGIGFEASQNSYHAVSNIHKSERYSIVFSFWNIDHPKSLKLENNTQLNQELNLDLIENIDINDLKLKKAIEFLFSIEFYKVKHSKNNLFEHLLGTYKILKQVGCTDDVCYAGLFHSIYGTNNFTISQIIERNKVKDVIGKSAEDLVWLYCKYNLRNFNKSENVIQLDSFETGKKTIIDKDIFSQLLELDFANSIEQFRILSDEEIVEELQYFSKLKELISYPFHKYLV